MTKGTHSGPAFNGTQASTILQWIDLEATAAGAGGGGGGMIYETTPFVPELNAVNTIPLDEIGVTGASVTFFAEPLASGLYLSDLTLVAGPT